MMRRLAVGYLFLQAAGCAAWWALLLLAPETRRHFRAAGAPDATLLAFGPGDLFLFAGGSAVAAWGLLRRRVWAWPALVAHAGAASYAGCYCVSLTVLTGGGAWPAAAFMAAPTVVPAWLAWKLRPRERPAGAGVPPSGGR